jgi:hypothetical protein
MNSRKATEMSELDIVIRNSLRARLYNTRPASSVRDAILRRAAEHHRRLWLPAFAPPARVNLAWQGHSPGSDYHLGLVVPLLYKLLGFPRQIV